MMQIAEYLPRPVPISQMIDLDDNGYISAFRAFAQWYEPLGMTWSDAMIYFSVHYDGALTPYARQTQLDLIRSVAVINSKKYDKMIAIYQAQYDPLQNYDRTEESTHTRTPDLTKGTTASSTTTGSSSTDTESQINQQHSSSTTPQNAQTVTETQVAPYDATAYQPKQRDTTTASGSTVTTDSYTGDPDTTTTTGTTSGTSSATQTETETGTDTTRISSRISGNIGVTTSQQMAESELALAAKMAIWLTIERDIAEAVTIGVW